MKLSEIKEGDYLFYTERPFSNYADSLVLIEKGLFAHTICVNYDGNYINEPEDGWGDEPMNVSEYFDENCWWPTTYKSSDGDPSEWMSKNYPLDQLDKNTKEKLKILSDGVFVLYSGERLGPIDKIIGIYTSEELAKNALSLCPKSTDRCHYSYFEQDLNVIPNHPEGHKAFICSFLKNENYELKSVELFPILEDMNSIHLFPSVDQFLRHYVVYCWATDEEHAVKVALGQIENWHNNSSKDH